MLTTIVKSNMQNRYQNNLLMKKLKYFILNDPTMNAIIRIYKAVIEIVVISNYS